MVQEHEPATQVSNTPQVFVPHTHADATHDSPAAQALPQPPQFAALVVMSTQSSKHLVVGAVQVFSHDASRQISPVAQALPHEPQFLGSLSRSTQAPEHE